MIFSSSHCCLDVLTMVTLTFLRQPLAEGACCW